MIPIPKYNNSSSTATETRISHWKNAKANKYCKVCSTKMPNGEWRFEIRGYNPLPCKAFEGTFGVLAKWLLDNGWVHDTSKADIIIIER